MSDAKLDFIRSLKPNHNMTDVIKYCVDHKIKSHTDAYQVVTRTNINPNNKPVSAKALLSLYKTAYDLMYDYIKNLEIKPTTKQSFKILKKKYELRELKKHLNPQECREFFFVTCPQILGDPPPVHAQQGGDPLDDNGNVYRDFIHVYPFEHPSKIDCRLYLNITPENSCKVGEILMKEAYKKHLRVYFKFDTTGSRNDTMLLYTSYERVNDFVQILQEIKKKRPELFSGAEKTSLLTAKVADCISYGEEPEYKHSSFNTERCDAIDEFVDSQLSKARMSIGKYNGVIKSTNGEKVSLRDFVLNKLKETFMEVLTQTQQDIKKKIYPDNIEKKNIKSYVEIQNNIFNSCQTNMPKYIVDQFEKQADRIVNNLKFGARTSSTFSIYFKTVKKELFNFSDDYINNLIKSRGYLDYPITIRYNMEEKLFSMFSAQQKIYNSITPENLQPYFDKHHCSLTHHYLNTETEALMSGLTQE